MFAWTLLVVQVLIFSCCWGKGLAVMCPGNNTVPLVSGARITENFQLSSSPGHGLSQVNLTGKGWCSEKLLSIIDPYLQFDFDNLYRIYTVTITGAEDEDSYVTAFRVESDFGNGKFQFIRDSANNGSQIFNTTLTNATETKPVLLNFSFGFPSYSLRIRPYSWTENPPCMRLEIYGCPEDPNNVSFPQNSNSNADTVRTTLAAALSIAVITVLIVTTIAIISVTTCYYMKYRHDKMIKFSKTYNTTEDLDDDRTIKHVKNEIYLATGRENIEGSRAPSTQYMHSTREPQPYEKPRQSYSTTLSNSNGYTIVDLNCSSSVSSAGYANVKKKKVKAYKTVSLENLTLETTTSQSGDSRYSVVQRPASETTASQSGDPGYSEVQSPTSKTAAAQFSDAGYSAVQSPTLEIAATQSNDPGYSAVRSHELTDDKENYLNVSTVDHLCMAQELGITESYGPEDFKV